MNNRYRTKILPSVCLPLVLAMTVSCEQKSTEQEPKSSQLVSVSTSKASETNLISTEFEGRYKVGTTYCNVEPLKMAFEVKWDKGKGSMVFFFEGITPEGRYIFVSKDSGKDGHDKFIFDTNQYDAGVFVRRDGKEFLVARSQKP